MSYSDEIDGRIVKVLNAATNDFVELVRISGLNPSSDFRRADLSGVDFSGADLTGFDFSGADLSGCKFDGALISEASFYKAKVDPAKLDLARGNGPKLQSSTRTEQLGAVHVQIDNHLQVIADDGTDLTPRSSKARGLIFLLATGKDMRRSRVWLRSKLWSTSGASHGSDSLRQTLSEIRKVLGSNAPCMVADRRSVSLDENLVSVSIVKDANFLKNLSFHDQRFHDWFYYWLHKAEPAPFDHGDVMFAGMQVKAASETVEIVLGKNLSVVTPQGMEATPNSQKAKALIALIATGSDMTRSRTWLQSKLWSNSSTAISSGGLRQTLMDVRNSLGKYAHCLITDRRSASFDSRFVSLIYHQNDRELLESIKIVDPEFQNWLQNLREQVAGSDFKTRQSISNISRVSDPQLHVEKAPANQNLTKLVLALRCYQAVRV